MHALVRSIAPVGNDSSPDDAALGDVEQALGRVVQVLPEAFVVRTASGELRAGRAVSCLIEPLAGDVVIVARAAGGAAYVLSVLEREVNAKATIRVDGDLEMKVPGGRFTVASQQGIDLVSAGDVAVAARGVSVNATSGHVVFGQLSYLGGLVRAEVDKIKTIAGTFDSVLERLSVRVKRSYKTVEEVDQVRAERIDYAARSTMNLHAENALVTAEKLVKVDGEQIHLG